MQPSENKCAVTDYFYPARGRNTSIKGIDNIKKAEQALLNSK